MPHFITKINSHLSLGFELIYWIYQDDLHVKQVSEDDVRKSQRLSGTLFAIIKFILIAHESVVFRGIFTG